MTVKPATVLSMGRPVMHAHPELHTAAAELLHTLDALEHEDRLHARRYLLHVYGLTVGITTPTATPLEHTETWAEDRNALAAASGHLLGLVPLECEDKNTACPRCALSRAHAEALLEVAHRG